MKIALCLALQVEACRAGWHGLIVDHDPRDLGGSVRAEWVCASCGEILAEVNYTGVSHD